MGGALGFMLGRCLRRRFRTSFRPVEISVACSFCEFLPIFYYYYYCELYSHMTGNNVSDGNEKSDESSEQG